ncbi:hypothetical protein DL769_011250 [Monosporascus sp. CRB-8-3]|nr:hypothetical protein DL769_011250 [Monosporascus sp. CRB-8-3]
MLPPVDVAVLKNNPDFERVYRKVTGVLLNPDGSTRNDALARKREAVREVRILMGYTSIALRSTTGLADFGWDSFRNSENIV